jgi:hypothetical protein
MSILSVAGVRNNCQYLTGQNCESPVSHQVIACQDLADVLPPPANTQISRRSDLMCKNGRLLGETQPFDWHLQRQIAMEPDVLSPACYCKKSPSLQRNCCHSRNLCHCKNCCHFTKSLSTRKPSCCTGRAFSYCSPSTLKIPDSNLY